MINTEELQKRVAQYGQNCINNQKRPSYLGLAAALGCSAMTVSHIVTGIYKDGHRYTNKPHSTRCVNNSDFDVIRALFDYDEHIND